MKFPTTEDYGGLTSEYLAALDAHFKISAERQAELRGMFRKTPKSDELPKWTDVFVCSGPLPVPDDLNPVINNLAMISLENEKQIIDTAKGIASGEWFFAIRVE